MAAWSRIAIGVAVASAYAAVGAGSASADAVDPPGACYGAATWVDAGFSEDSASVDRGAEIEIPQADTVQWVGGIGDAQPGDTTEPRPVEGAVEVQVGGQWIMIDDGWSDDDATSLANSGTHVYDLPSALIGIPIPLRGHHTEPDLSCEGDVVLIVAGSATENPVFYAGGALFVLAGAGLVYAGRIKIKRVS
jgi:hypothetical protein